MEQTEGTVRAPAEVGHVTQGSISKLSLEKIVQLRGQEVPDLSVQQAEVVQVQVWVLLKVRFSTKRTNKMLHGLLSDHGREPGLKTGLTESTAAVRHQDHLAEGHMLLAHGAQVMEVSLGRRQVFIQTHCLQEFTCAVAPPL